MSIIKKQTATLSLDQKLDVLETLGNTVMRDRTKSFFGLAIEHTHGGVFKPDEIDYDMNTAVEFISKLINLIDEAEIVTFYKNQLYFTITNITISTPVQTIFDTGLNVLMNFKHEQQRINRVNPQ